MTLWQVVAVALVGGVLATGPAHLQMSPWWTTALVGLAATASAAGTYLAHAAALALSWRVARALSHLDGVIVWAVHRDGTIEWSVGGELRKHWREVAPDGIQTKAMHLDNFGDIPERDAGLAAAWVRGRSSWVVTVEGITWLSWARRVDGLVIVLTTDASTVATATRHRLISEALGES